MSKKKVHTKDAVDVIIRRRSSPLGLAKDVKSATLSTNTRKPVGGKGHYKML